MNFTIENEDKLINESDEKKLASIARRISKANKELIDLGYTSYLSAHGSWNIMNGDSHDSSNSCNALYENVVANFQLQRIDAGDW